ncbi:MAG TPA: hypothetical protein VGN34_34325, partial [Ktedonobacteraceae bacterium]
MALFEKHQEYVSQALEGLQATLIQWDQTYGQLQLDLLAVQYVVTTIQEACITLVTQQIHEVKTEVEQHRSELMQEIAQQIGIQTEATSAAWKTSQE